MRCKMVSDARVQNEAEAKGPIANPPKSQAMKQSTTEQDHEMEDTELKIRAKSQHKFSKHLGQTPRRRQFRREEKKEKEKRSRLAQAVLTDNQVVFVWASAAVARQCFLLLPRL